MQPSIPVRCFVNPKSGSREHNAIQRAIDIQPAVHLVGYFEAAAGQERWYRVRAKRRDRHAVIIWYSVLSEQEEGRCDCEAFTIPVSGPTPCFHLAAVLIFEATQPEQKLPSMGRKRDVRTSTATI